MNKLLLITLLTLGAGQALAFNMPVMPKYVAGQGYVCPNGYQIVFPKQMPCMNGICPGAVEDPYCVLK
jgi:hypothetical protein